MVSICRSWKLGHGSALAHGNSNSNNPNYLNLLPPLTHEDAWPLIYPFKLARTQFIQASSAALPFEQGKVNNQSFS